MKTTLILCVCLAFLGCNGDNKTPDKSNSAPVVYTTFYPTAYFTERIAKEYVTVVCPVPEDEDAIFWQAYKHPEIIQQYQQADLIILNGAKFAKWVGKVSLPAEKVVDTAKPFAKEFIFIEEAVTHSHGGGKEHTHAGLDGHTWVDPVNAKIQAGEIKKALDKLLPQHQEELTQNFRQLEKDLDELIAILTKYQSSPNSKQPLLASHPAYNYIARRFGWNIKNLDIDPEEMPSDKTFAKIKRILQSHTAKYIIWESYPTQEIAKRFQDELNLESVEFSPCELLAKEEQQQGVDYLTVMKKNLQNIKKIWE